MRANPHDFRRLRSGFFPAAQFSIGNGLPNMGPHNMRIAYEVRLEDGNRLRVSRHQNVGKAYVKFVSASIARIEAFHLLGETDSFHRFPGTDRSLGERKIGQSVAGSEFNCPLTLGYGLFILSLERIKAAQIRMLGVGMRVIQS